MDIDSTALLHPNNSPQALDPLTPPALPSPTAGSSHVVDHMATPSSVSGPAVNHNSNPHSFYSHAMTASASFPFPPFPYPPQAPPASSSDTAAASPPFASPQDVQEILLRLEDSVHLLATLGFTLVPPPPVSTITQGLFRALDNTWHVYHTLVEWWTRIDQYGVHLADQGSGVVDPLASDSAGPLLNTTSSSSSSVMEFSETHPDPVSSNLHHPFDEPSTAVNEENKQDSVPNATTPPADPSPPINPGALSPMDLAHDSFQTPSNGPTDTATTSDAKPSAASDMYPSTYPTSDLYHYPYPLSPTSSAAQPMYASPAMASMAAAIAAQHQAAAMAQGSTDSAAKYNSAAAAAAMYAGYLSMSFNPPNPSQHAMNPTTARRRTASQIAAGDVSDDGAPKQKRKKSRNPGVATYGRCLSCNTTETPEWRKGPQGRATLCNACGLHWAKMRRRTKSSNVNGQCGIQGNFSLPPAPEGYMTATIDPSIKAAVADRHLDSQQCHSDLPEPSYPQDLLLSNTYAATEQQFPNEYPCSPTSSRSPSPSMSPRPPFSTHHIASQNRGTPQLKDEDRSPANASRSLELSPAGAVSVCID